MSAPVLSFVFDSIISAGLWCRHCSATSAVRAKYLLAEHETLKMSGHVEVVACVDCGAVQVTCVDCGAVQVT